MWKLILILSLIFSQSDINIIYNSPQSYPTKEACDSALDGDDVSLETWISAKTDVFVALPTPEGAKKDLTYFCSEVDNNEQPI